MSTGISAAELRTVTVGDRRGLDDLRREFEQSVSEMYRHLDDAEPAIRHAVAGSIKPVDALKLTALARQCAPQRVLEVGSFLGFSTRVLLDATAGTGAVVVSVDPRVRHRIFDDPKAHVVAFNPTTRLVCRDAFFGGRNIAPMLHDYLTYEPRMRPRAAKRILRAIDVIDQPFDRFDMVFIDGDHSYRATMENLALALRMVGPGGVIAIHDALTWPPVRPAATDVADLVPGVAVLGVTGANPECFFADDEPAWKQRTREIAGRLVGSPVDGLCVVAVDAHADVEAMHAAAAAITAAVIADCRGQHRDLVRDRPYETEFGKVKRRTKLLVRNPREAALRVTGRRGRSGPAPRSG